MGPAWGANPDRGVFRTKDGEKTWEKIYSLCFLMSKSEDGGKTFKVILSYSRVYPDHHAESQVEEHCPVLLPGKEVPQLLFFGAEFELYIGYDSSKIWNKWKKGFPSVPRIDMQIHPREKDLLIATFGRAVFVLDNISVLRKLQKTYRFREVVKSFFISGCLFVFFKPSRRSQIYYRCCL